MTETTVKSYEDYCRSRHGNSALLDSSEIFDSSSGAFSPSDTMMLARKSQTATLLTDNNRILVAGGKSTDGGDTVQAEIYDIELGTFRRVADMSTERSLHTATLLNNGKVLEAAGRNGATPTASTELFDPTTETFSDTGSLNLGRKRHDATLLPDGRVFVSGGSNMVESGTPTCEIYDSNLGTWTFSAEAMAYGRTDHRNTLLADGTVLVTGGILTPPTAELFNPPDQTFSDTGSLIERRSHHVAIRLINPVWGSLVNQVLIVGGASVNGSAFGGLEKALASVEIYDPSLGAFSFFGNMTGPRENHTATMLNDGSILITGGVGSPAFSATGEVLAIGVSPTPTPSLTPTATPRVTPRPRPTPAPRPTPR